jgi:hypothetical protein
VIFAALIFYPLTTVALFEFLWHRRGHGGV